MVEKQFTVIDETGVHVRPASMLVNIANKFKSDIFIIHDGKDVNLKSIMGVMSLGIGLDEEFKIRAEGSDEQAALDELEQALKNDGLVN